MINISTAAIILEIFWLSIFLLVYLSRCHHNFPIKEKLKILPLEEIYFLQ